MSDHELTGLVLKEALYVHSKLGPGLLESVYEKCLAFRLIKAGLAIEIQKPIPLVFDEVHLECGFRCDLLIENRLLIEIKAVEAINDIHYAQVITYLKLAKVELGLILNFNVLKLKDGIKRMINDGKKPDTTSAN